MAIPKLIDESARLKTYSKNVYGSPPMNGIHFGHVQEAIGNCNISTTCPKKNGAYPTSGRNVATCP